MEHVYMKETHESPKVEVNQEFGKITIRGKSTLVDPKDFYKNLLHDMLEYLKLPRSLTTIEFHLCYMNTSSSKWIFHLLKSIEKNKTIRNTVTIDWYYEYDDESVQEAGEVYQSLIKIPFNIIPEYY